MLISRRKFRSSVSVVTVALAAQHTADPQRRGSSRAWHVRGRVATESNLRQGDCERGETQRLSFRGNRPCETNGVGGWKHHRSRIPDLVGAVGRIADPDPKASAPSNSRRYSAGRLMAVSEAGLPAGHPAGHNRGWACRDFGGASSACNISKSQDIVEDGGMQHRCNALPPTGFAVYGCSNGKSRPSIACPRHTMRRQ